MNRYDPSELRAHPLAERRSLLSADETLVDPDSTPAVTDAAATIAEAAKNIRAARERGAAAILVYGARCSSRWLARESSVRTKPE